MVPRRCRTCPGPNPRSGASSTTLLALALALVPLLGAACPDGEPATDGGTDAGPTSGCEPSVIGDATAPIEMEVVLRTALGDQVDLGPYDDVELFRPPQGGKVFLVGARVKNVDTCGLRITGTLRDPCNGQIMGLEGRPFRTVVTDAGWAEPLNPRSLSNYANVPTCPRAAATRDMNDELYELSVTVEDRDGRTATTTFPVVPRCAQPGALGRQCHCECADGYVLGTPCQHPDAGYPDVDPPRDDAGVPLAMCP